MKGKKNTLSLLRLEQTHDVSVRIHETCPSTHARDGGVGCVDFSASRFNLPQMILDGLDVQIDDGPLLSFLLTHAPINHSFLGQHSRFGICLLRPDGPILHSLHLADFPTK